MNVAVVESAWLLANVTGPGPLTTDQVVDNVLPVGCPSSLAVPDSVTWTFDCVSSAIGAGPNAACSHWWTVPMTLLSNVAPFQVMCQSCPPTSSAIRRSPTMSLNCDADAPT